jgi:hypothetical protein
MLNICYDRRWILNEICDGVPSQPFSSLELQQFETGSDLIVVTQNIYRILELFNLIETYPFLSLVILNRTLTFLRIINETIGS